jgi:PAT family beta-lactamase induction signal transducer AmpG
MSPFLSQNRPLRLTTLCVLYCAQGIPDGFVRTALKNYLYDRGVSVDDVGNVVAMVSLPWMMKWAWGPFIDRYGYAPMGRRRPWILLAQSLMAVTLIGMLLIPDVSTNLRLLAAMVLLVNICASLQDVSVDALAVDMLPPQERGAANGFMYASSYGGTLVGGGLLGTVLVSAGLTAAIGAQVGMLAAIIMFPLFLRERPGDLLAPRRGSAARWSPTASATRPDSLGQVFRMLFRAYSLRSTLMAAVLAALSLVAVNAHFVYWPKHAQDQLGWSTEAWVGLEGGWGAILGLAGSVAGGLLATAIGAKRAVITALMSMSACWFSYAWLSDYWNNETAISALFMAESAIAGALQVTMFALFMGICWAPVAATQFTSYTAMMNFANMLGANQADVIQESFGIVDSHVALGCLQLALVAAALAIDPDQTRRKLGAGERPTSPPDAPEMDAGLVFPPEPPR